MSKQNNNAGLGGSRNGGYGLKNRIVILMRCSALDPHFKKLKLIDLVEQERKINRFKYPNLIKLVKKYLCIPATSTESERTFSNLKICSEKNVCVWKERPWMPSCFSKINCKKMLICSRKNYCFSVCIWILNITFFAKKSNRVISFFYLATNQISHTCQLHDFGRVNLFSRPVDWPAGWQVFSRLPSGWKNLFRDQH